ncbi:hypothetical protein B9Z44_02435 [Limnohabitans curvus]|uniref:Uncharacterized protein n=1 Tax=Limnohabitans curvus TaxID=323423 RepID=A0A315ERZ9_9BURK|nr:hypothetical protein [Limnohabitans curvus]PUE60670.1 hypothetical protein B9Z44_02435 [Limnohabitans curvus]
MLNIRNSLIGLCVATASMASMAQNADEHKDHHPAGIASPAVTIKKSPSNSMSADKMSSMDKQMKAMQAMHEKMASAKTPEERQALMAEHMKMMQDGMGMMKEMGGMQGGKAMTGNMADRQQMMEKRMDMMESMMQMMIDRTPSAPVK